VSLLNIFNILFEIKKPPAMLILLAKTAKAAKAYEPFEGK